MIHEEEGPGQARAKENTNGCFPYIRQCSRSFPQMTSFCPKNKPMRPKSLTHFTEEKTDIQRDSVTCPGSQGSLGTFSRRGVGIPSGNQVCLHSGSVESQGHCAQVRKCRTLSLWSCRESLPSHHQEGGGLKEKLDLNCFVCWPLGQGAAPSTMALVTRVHGPHYSHAHQSSLLLDAACGIFVSS